VRAAAASVDELLATTSRTFALTIPLLPEPTRREVALAYLLLRAFDTLEDATLWSPARRVAALDELQRLVAGLDVPGLRAWAARARRTPPSSDPACLDLLDACPTLVEELRRLRVTARRTILHHVARTAREMARFQEPAALRSLAELRAYCYGVAGIVGEMLTDLFLLRPEPFQRLAPRLRRDAAAFGEGLQLVNVLRDHAVDARQGRVFLPPSIEPAAVFALARRDLDRAGDYVLALQGSAAPRGLVLFTALPVLLGRATLDVLEEGARGKLTRGEVTGIVDELKRAVADGRPAVRRDA
jgi:farnesyl-diphosphate farnesyltransferase